MTASSCNRTVCPHPCHRILLSANLAKIKTTISKEIDVGTVPDTDEDVKSYICIGSIVPKYLPSQNKCGDFPDCKVVKSEVDFGISLSFGINSMPIHITDKDVTKELEQVSKVTNDVTTILKEVKLLMKCMYVSK